MNRRTVLGLAGASLAVGLAGCMDEGEEGTVDDTGNGESDDPAVTVHEHELESEFGGCSVVGEAENTSGEEQDYIELKATMFDENGTRIDDWFTNLTDVPDGQRFTFEIMTTTDCADIDNYELEWSTSPF